MGRGTGGQEPGRIAGRRGEGERNGEEGERNSRRSFLPSFNGSLARRMFIFAPAGFLSALAGSVFAGCFPWPRWIFFRPRWEPVRRLVHLPCFRTDILRNISDHFLVFAVLNLRMPKPPAAYVVARSYKY